MLWLRWVSVFICLKVTALISYFGDAIAAIAQKVQMNDTKIFKVNRKDDPQNISLKAVSWAKWLFCELDLKVELETSKVMFMANKLMDGTDVKEGMRVFKFKATH